LSSQGNVASVAATCDP